MDYVFTGFRQDNSVRQYSFEGIDADRKRTAFTVGADLALIRKYDIRVQELPLLCRAVLERRIAGEPRRSLTFTEEDMRTHATSAAAAREAAAHKRKSGRRPVSPRVGQAWRGPRP